MQAKYADVVSLDETLAFLSEMPPWRSLLQSSQRPEKILQPQAVLVGRFFALNSCHSPSGIVGIDDCLRLVDAERVTRKATGAIHYGDGVGGYSASASPTTRRRRY